MTKAKILELDFGMGNIRSLQKAFEHLGARVEVSSDPQKIARADVLLIPGDGAFGKAMSEIKRLDMLDQINRFYESGKFVMGICIGFQLLFETSEEFGAHRGLSFLKGGISRFSAEQNLIIPHMGWSDTRIITPGRLLKDIPDNSYFYYVHSYRFGGVHQYATASCNYGGDFTAVIEKDNLFATQFHPEKSHKWGLKLLSNFLEVL